MREGDTDVDDDGFVRSINAAQVVDRGGVGHTGDGSCMEVCDFGERDMGLRLAKGLSVLLVMQAGGENEDI
jgi:hypothetical protein